MGAAWLKGGLIYFCIQKEGVLERDVKERGTKYRNYRKENKLQRRLLKERGAKYIQITVPPFLPLPSQTCCRRRGNCRG
jgi:hypothetical protein